MNKKIFILFMILLLAIKNYSIGETSGKIPKSKDEYSHVFLMKVCTQKYKRLDQESSDILTKLKNNIIKVIDTEERKEGWLFFVKSKQPDLSLKNVEWIKTKEEYKKELYDQNTSLR